MLDSAAGALLLCNFICVLVCMCEEIGNASAEYLILSITLKYKKKKMLIVHLNQRYCKNSKLHFLYTNHLSVIVHSNFRHAYDICLLLISLLMTSQSASTLLHVKYLLWGQ